MGAFSSVLGAWHLPWWSAQPNVGQVSHISAWGWLPALLISLLGFAVLGGLLLGYGARLAYGCNIGAYFSGIASSSLHGWLWLVAAFLGSILGTRLRPWFGLSVEGNLTRAQAGPVARD
jgi:uncharacterized membrane protein YedE/YeeE